MADEDWHAHTGCCEHDFGIENLLRLRHHFPFFFGEAILHEDVNVRNEIKGNALGEFLGLNWIRDEDSAGLAE